MMRNILLSKKFGVFLIVLLSFWVGAENVNGATRYSVATGNWSSTATWSATSGGASGASVPVSGDIVFIQGNRTVTVNVAVACANVSIATGSTLSVGAFNFTVSGTTTVNGTIIHTSATGTKTMGTVVVAGGTWTSNASETYAISGLTLTGSTFNGNNSSPTFSIGVGGFTVTSGTTNTFNRGNITSTAGTNVINGTLIFASTNGTKTFGSILVSGGTWTNNVNETFGATTLTLANATLNGISSGRINVSSTFNVTVGTSNTIGNLSLYVTGNTTIDGRLVYTATGGTKDFTGNVTISSTGSWSCTANEGFTFRGNLQNDGSFSTGGTAAHSFTGINKTLSGLSSLTIPTMYITGRYINNTTLTIDNQLNGTNGTLTQGTSSTLNIRDSGAFSLTNLVASAAGNTVSYYRAGNQKVRSGGTTTSYYNLILAGSGTKTLTGLTSVTGNLTTSGAAIATTAASLTIGGNLNVGAGSTLTVGGYNLNVAGTTTVSGIHAHSLVAGTKTYTGDVTINSGGSWTNAGNSPFTFQGSLTNNGTLSDGTGIYTFAGSGKTLNGTSGLVIRNTTITGTYTNNTTLTVATALSGSGSLTQGANQTLNIGGTSAITELTATANSNTVNYTGASQTVKPINYYHLTLSGSGVKTMPASVISVAGNFTTSGAVSATAAANYTIAGNVTLGSGTTFNAGSFSHAVGGNWAKNGATFNASSGTVTFNGSSMQTMGGTVQSTFNNLRFDNSSGFTLNQPINAANIVFNAGIVNSASGLLSVTGSTAGSISGNLGVSYVSGPLARTLPAGLVNGNYIFPIGKSGYNPLELVNLNTNSGGSVVVKAEVSDANSGGTPGTGLSSLYFNRYWNAAITSGSGNFTNTQVRLTDTGLGTEDAIGQSSAQTGAYDRISDDPPSGNTLISFASPNQITTLGYFAIGEKPVVTIAATQDGAEGGSDGLFTLTTTKPFTVTRNINITITGTAANGTDYTTINSPVTFSAGLSSVDIPVPIINDASFEPTETLIVTINNGTGYAIGSASGAIVNIVDNDNVGIEVSPASGLQTTEAMGTATFAVVLTSQPTANVTIGFSSNDLTEGTVSPTSIVFTSANWNVARTVTIAGVNDFVQDGNIAYSIITAPATSGDANYSGLNAADVLVTNMDNDVAAINVSPGTGLVTTESGGTAIFTIVLNSQPTANVTIGLSSGDTSEGTVLPVSVTFTTANWSVAQPITVTGVDDFIVDGNVDFSIVTAATTSADAIYNSLNAPDVSVTNNDNDVAGIIVDPISGLNTTEAGEQASFTIVLNSQPSANVTIALVSDDTGEGTVSPSFVTFTSGNWDIPQTVTVTGVDGPMADGDITYHIVTGAASSSDPNYNGINPDDVTVVNIDNDVAGITVNPISGLTTTEAGGTASFSIVLNTQPAGNVTIGLSSNNTSEGTLSVSSVVFTDLNWNISQNITITGIDDAIDDGNVVYSVITDAASSSDGDYNGVNPSNVSVTNIDNDVAEITVNPTSGLTTTEAGGTATFTIRLKSEPLANVTIGLSSGNSAEGTVLPSSVTFTSLNWNSAQTITVTGVDDDIDDGDIDYNIFTAAATSADGTYGGMNATDVLVTNSDDDTAGITVTPTSGLTTTEAGGTTTFTVVLNSEPTAIVVIDVTSDDPTEGSISPDFITFTSGNWDSPQTITIAGEDDLVMDGNILYNVLITAAPGADVLYNAVSPDDVPVTNTDNDVAGFTVSPTTGLVTTEAGGTATFTVKLNSEPTADVAIGITSNDLTEGTVSSASLTFTSFNWNTTQTITVTGMNDFFQDGNASYTIVTAPATSSDPNYNNLNPADVAATNTDNDVAGIMVSPASGLVTTESGGTTSFSIVLTSEPTHDVTIGLNSGNGTEGTISPVSVIFTPASWNVGQDVTITGVDDFSIDGNKAYTIITNAAGSADPNYNNFNAPDVSVTNNDDDTAGILVDPTSGLSTSEDGGTATFTIELTTIPTASVTIAFSSSDVSEGTVSPASITIIPANWNIPATVTVFGVDDLVDDNDIGYTIISAAATSADLNYNGIDPSDVAVANTNDDLAGITVDPTSGLVTSENLTSDVFAIVLDSEPTNNVIIGLSVDDNSEGTVSPASVTFTPANWNTAQTITVTGKNDNQNDGDIGFNVQTAAATSSDSKYSGVNAEDVSVTNLDNDSPGITVSPLSGLLTTEAGGAATFSVVLITQPSENVVIPVSSSDATEGSVSNSALTFTGGNWNTPQVVTITGLNDVLADGDIGYLIVLGTVTSDDNDYDGLDPNDVAVTNTDMTPTIDGFLPAQVCYNSGASIVVTGSKYINVISVTVNGLAASYTVNSPTQITLTLPATATTGTIGVVTETGTVVSSSSVTVNPLPTATISGTTTVCKDAASPDITFVGANGLAPYTFTYTINGGLPLQISTSSGNSVTVQATVSVTGIFNFELTDVSDTNTCSQAQSGNAIVTVNSLVHTSLIQHSGR